MGDNSIFIVFSNICMVICAFENPPSIPSFLATLWENVGVTQAYTLK
jgi:hypothetical protein